ncbi:hypothetical protein ABN764_24800 [Paenibacillaceae sp. P-4]|uniref:hypothetical protein n=1 Tax=Paenibacillaceae bacterium P-4 TaxID=3160969 RepID=UPI0032E84BEF
MFFVILILLMSPVLPVVNANEIESIVNQVTEAFQLEMVQAEEVESNPEIRDYIVSNGFESEILTGNESSLYLVEKFGLKPIQASSESVSEAARELKLKHGLDKVYPVIYNVDQKFLVKRTNDKVSGKLSVSHMWSINFVTSNTGITVTVLNIGNDS